MIKTGDCILIKPKGKWQCVKYYSHTKEHLFYVPMSIDMLHKRHIRKIKFDMTKIRDIHQGKGENPKKGVKQVEFDN